MQITVHFLNGNDESTQDHYRQKEYRDDVVVQINDLYYEVYYYTEGSLIREISTDGFFTLPGLIVVEEIATDVILTSVAKLASLNYYDRLTPYDSLPVNSRFLFQWYTVEFENKQFEKKVSHKLN